MKKIKIFLASSITDLEVDRKAIGDFFTQLNNIYIDRGIYFQLVKCDTYDNAIAKDGKQAQYDKEIRESELCFVMFFKKVGDYTKHEFEVALDAYKNCEKPKIVVYFKYVENGEEATAEVKAFMLTLDKELKHYYNSYQSIDTLKLGMLMQIKLMGLDAEEPVVENGKVMFGGEVIADAKNVPMFAGNKSLTDLKNRLTEITPRYFDLQAEFVKDPNNMDIMREYSALATEKAEIEKQIKALEKTILEATKTMLENTAKGDLSPRQIAAYRAFEKGDYDAALEVLDLGAIMADLTHNEQMSNGYIERVQINVNELLSRIEVLKAAGITQASAAEIEELYQTAYERIEKYDLDKEPLYDFVQFLYNQNNYAKALEITKQLQYHCADPRANIPEDKVAKMNNMLGVLYSSVNKFDLAENAYNQALDIHIKFAKKYPDAFEPRSATSYNNLGELYRSTNRFDLAEDAYKKALDIRIKLTEKNPDAFEPDLATIYNNLGNQYRSTNRFELAENAYKKALDICIKLAGKNPDAFEPDLARSYGNLGNLYYQTSRFDLAEDAYKKASNIYIKLAEKNPDAFEPGLAMSYNNLGNLYANTNRLDLAEDAYKKALVIRVKLAEKNPVAFKPDLAMSYNNLGNLYYRTKRFDLAEDASKMALDIYIKLAEKNPDAFEPDLARAYLILIVLYSNTNRLDLAREAYEKAYAIAKKYPGNLVCAQIISLLENNDDE